MSSRPRQKRLLAKALVRWRSFVSETEKVSVYLVESTAGTHEAEQFSSVVETIMKPFAVAAQAHAARMALTLVLSAFDLELYSRDEYAVAYWMAWQIGLGLEQLQEQLSELGGGGSSAHAAEDKSAMSLLISVLEIWFDLSKLQTPPPSLSQSTFNRRFKWLKLSSRDRDGVPQDTHFELKDFWDGFTQAQAQAQSKADVTLLADRLDEIQPRIRALQAIIADRANPKGRMYHMCREDAHALLERLLHSVEHSVAQLRDTSRSQSQGRWDFDFDFGDAKTVHPWFPPLIQRL